MNNTKAFNRYEDGVTYDVNQDTRSKIGRTKTQNQDSKFYANLAKRTLKNTNGGILLVGGGTGRIAKPMEENAYQVTLLDSSPGMLRQARKKFPDLELVQADMRDFRLNKLFDLIIAHFDLVNHLLTLEDFKSFLRCIGKHLKADGRFAFDVVNPNFDFFLSCHDNGKMFDSAYHDPHGNGPVVVTQTREYDYAHQILRLKKYYWYIDLDREVVEDIKFRCYTLQELIILLHYNGFEVEQLFGDFQEGSFSSDSKKIILICRKV